MTDILTLDTSKTNTGWARWSKDQARPQCGSKCLGSEYSTRADVYVAMHKLMLELTVFGVPEYVFIEAPQNPKHLKYPTKFDNDRLLIGLVENVHYLSKLLGVRQVIEVENRDWWIPFCGRGIPKKKEGLNVKKLTMQRCRQLGFKPKNHDEADALGILDYACDFQGVIPPWRKNEVLRPPLGKVVA